MDQVFDRFMYFTEHFSELILLNAEKAWLKIEILSENQSFLIWAKFETFSMMITSAFDNNFIQTTYYKHSFQVNQCIILNQYSYC